MPSTRGFASRRRGVRDSRPPPVHDSASVDWSVQHGEAFVPARSCAGSCWGEGLGRVWRPRRFSPGSRPVGCPRAGGKKLLLPGAHFRDPLSS
jgi:hypothetical protein